MPTQVRILPPPFRQWPANRLASRSTIRLDAAALAPVVGARFLSIPANHHRAPAGALVSRVIVKRPAAVTTGAGLQALPATVDHRSVDDRVQGADRAVEPGVAVDDEAGAIRNDPHAFAIPRVRFSGSSRKL